MAVALGDSTSARSAQERCRSVKASLKLGRDSEDYPAWFFMSSIYKSLVAACIFLMLAGPGSTKAGPQGFLEGHLKIVAPGAVEPDNMPRPDVPPQSYAEYPLTIRSQDGKKEITRVTPDKSGNYRVALPPGAYILDVQHHVGQRIGANPQSFTVISNQTVHVDMNIFVGFERFRA
jgi:hypothetical protein